MKLYSCIVRFLSLFNTIISQDGIKSDKGVRNWIDKLFVFDASRSSCFLATHCYWYGWVYCKDKLIKFSTWTFSPVPLIQNFPYFRRVCCRIVWCVRKISFILNTKPPVILLRQRFHFCTDVCWIWKKVQTNHINLFVTYVQCVVFHKMHQGVTRDTHTLWKHCEFPYGLSFACLRKISMYSFWPNYS